MPVVRTLLAARKRGWPRPSIAGRRCIITRGRAVIAGRQPVGWRRSIAELRGAAISGRRPAGVGRRAVIRRRRPRRRRIVGSRQAIPGRRTVIIIRRSVRISPRGVIGRRMIAGTRAVIRQPFIVGRGIISRKAVRLGACGLSGERLRRHQDGRSGGDDAEVARAHSISPAEPQRESRPNVPLRAAKEQDDKTVSLLCAFWNFPPRHDRRHQKTAGHYLLHTITEVTA
jgi:hypothetical protein